MAELVFPFTLQTRFGGGGGKKHVPRKVNPLARHQDYSSDGVDVEHVHVHRGGDGQIDTRDHQAQRRRNFQELFGESLKHQSRQLWNVARDPKFQEAVLWQNRNGFETGIQPLAAQPAPAAARNQKQREREQLIANYLQRYCVKNDTIGFFGPVAWGEITTTGTALVASPGPSLAGAFR